jgi:hypothetical protein
MDELDRDPPTNCHQGARLRLKLANSALRSHLRETRNLWHPFAAPAEIRAALSNVSISREKKSYSPLNLHSRFARPFLVVFGSCGEFAVTSF